jgi:hypothetical protein
VRAGTLGSICWYYAEAPGLTARVPISFINDDFHLLYTSDLGEGKWRTIERSIYVRCCRCFESSIKPPSSWHFPFDVHVSLNGKSNLPGPLRKEPVAMSTPPGCHHRAATTGLPPQCPKQNNSHLSSLLLLYPLPHFLQNILQQHPRYIGSGMMRSNVKGSANPEPSHPCKSTLPSAFSAIPQSLGSVEPNFWPFENPVHGSPGIEKPVVDFQSTPCPAGRVAGAAAAESNNPSISNLSGNCAPTKPTGFRVLRAGAFGNVQPSIEQDGPEPSMVIEIGTDSDESSQATTSDKRTKRSRAMEADSVGTEDTRSGALFKAIKSNRLLDPISDNSEDDVVLISSTYQNQSKATRLYDFKPRSWHLTNPFNQAGNTRPCAGRDLNSDLPLRCNPRHHQTSIPRLARTLASARNCLRTTTPTVHSGFGTDPIVMVSNSQRANLKPYALLPVLRPTRVETASPQTIVGPRRGGRGLSCLV